MTSDGDVVIDSTLSLQVGYEDRHVDGSGAAKILIFTSNSPSRS